MVAETNLKTTLAILVFFVVLAVSSTVHAKIIYVDADANGVNDGSSWADAYNYLQDALADANSSPKPVEIRVAQGTYKPDKDTAHPDGTRDRTATFQLINGVTIKGGYAGFGEPDPSARDIELYETILSADLNSNDVVIAEPNPMYMWKEPSRAENSFHIVTGSGTDSTAILDGLTITAGQANVYQDHSIGAGMYSSHGNPTITNCTFRANWARSKGGGMYIDYSSLTLSGCRFVENFAYWDGGGICNVNSSPILVDCIFVSNYTEWDGGGMQNRNGSSALMFNCTFTENRGRFGGGLMNNRSHPFLFGCVFTGNRSRTQGGAVLNHRSNPTLINCTLNGNRSISAGGILSDENSNVTLTNSILWGNVDDYDVQEWAQILGGTLNINHCCVQGWAGSLGGGKHAEDPLFVADGYWDDSDTPYDPDDDSWVKGDVRLRSSSPCIDAGDNTQVPPDIFDLDGNGNSTEPIPVDIEGNPRFTDDPATPDTGSGTPPIVDMGAYEGPHQGFLVSNKSVIVDEGQTAILMVALAMDPLESIDVEFTVESGDVDITIESAAILTFDSSNFRNFQTITLAAAEDSDNLDGTVLLRISAAGFLTTRVELFESDNDPVSHILFVDESASGDNNGTSWVDAYPNLQDALSIARTHPNVEQVWVAQGIYRPAEPNGSRHVSFMLVEGVTLKGGYAGCNGANSDVRNIKTYETVLSGDLNGDDTGLLDDPSRMENSNHVVMAYFHQQEDMPVVLDGLTVTAGRADGPTYMSKCGAGLYCLYGNLTLRDCKIIGNKSLRGGGIRIDSTSVKMTRCSISGNSDSGIINRTDELELDNCILSNNSGWGVSNYGCVTLTNCTLYKSGISGDDDAYATITNCILGHSPLDTYKPQTEVNYSRVDRGTESFEGVGNIYADPWFVEPGYWDANGVWVEGDYHLLTTSPCIDAGNPNYVPEPNETDLDGKPRMLDGNNDGIPIVDMGAYEYSPPIPAEVRILPRTINLASKGKWITALLWLPEDYNVADIDPNSVFLEDEIKAESLLVDEQEQIAIAKFSRSELQAILSIGQVELTITGQFTDGTPFEAADIIRVLNKAGGKSAK